ncbi:hypothetical protein [Gilvibacter sp.]|uniref:hypothetical protein n=1 Tax=Gilvibacter sp. TaxID=2729997 RepID=UPI0025C5F63B|nr:hypothetical protein [Gilvibacter sp.]NQX76388.1 hypothetical protein [Gilvibacter sp.]
MSHKINIHDSGTIVKIQPGIYKVYALGGWKVRLGAFSMSLIDQTTGNEITSKQVKFGLQDRRHGVKAKQIATISVPEWHEYEIRFINPEDVQVYHSPLFPGLFDKPLDNKQLEVNFG